MVDKGQAIKAPGSSSPTIMSMSAGSSALKHSIQIPCHSLTIASSAPRDCRAHHDHHWVESGVE